MQEEIPNEVREYLSAGDGLGRAAVIERHPNVERTLKEPKTRAALFRYLAGDEAWEEASSNFTLKVLEFLRAGAVPGEAARVRPFLMHANPFVRVRAYDFLMTLYFPDKNREAMLMLLQNMLVDDHDAVRVRGARYVERAGVGPEFRDFLLRWRRLALGRDWKNKESFEVIERLLKE